MRLALQCTLILILAAIADVLWAFHLRFFLKNDQAIAVSTIMVIHFVGYFYTKWFIEYKKEWQRLLITFAGSVGAGIGCWLTMQ